MRKKMMTRKIKWSAEEFVFDGDSDSGDDIEGFNQQVKRIDPNVKDKNGDSGSDEEEDDDEEDKMVEDTDSSEDDDDEVKEKTLKAHVEKQNQISKLHEQLSKLEQEEQLDESESSDNEDNEEDADEDSDAADESDAIEDSDADDKPSISKNVQKDHAKKRKVNNDDFENEVKKVKNDSVVEELDEREKFKNELSKLSLDEIQKLKEKIGLKLFNQSLGVSKPAIRSKEEFKRANKNRPREMSSKKTVPRFREVVAVAKVESKRDPRFDPLCGEFDEKIFRDSYKFVSDIKNDELNKLKKQLAEEEDPERKEKIKFLITRMKNQQ